MSQPSVKAVRHHYGNGHAYTYRYKGETYSSQRRPPFPTAAAAIKAGRKSRAKHVEWDAAVVSPATPALPPPRPGMTSGEKIAIGVVAIGIIGGIFLLARNASAAQQGAAAAPAQLPPASGATGATGASGTSTGTTGAGGAPSAALTAAATAMQAALAKNGYCQADVPIYKAFQTQAIAGGLNLNNGVDGLPGPDTMNALSSVLGGVTINGPGGTALKIYPWQGGFTTGNVPTNFVGGSLAQWNPSNATGCST